MQKNPNALNTRKQGKEGKETAAVRHLSGLEPVSVVSKNFGMDM